jgi:hypothetical protein
MGAFITHSCNIGAKTSTTLPSHGNSKSVTNQCSTKQDNKYEHYRICCYQEQLIGSTLNGINIKIFAALIVSAMLKHLPELCSSEQCSEKESGYFVE